MNESRIRGLTRRDFLAAASAWGGNALLGLPRRAGAEPPPEITKIRFVHSPAICLAPQYLAEELLRMDGFSEVEYVKIAGETATTLVSTGRADISMQDIPGIMPFLDDGKPVAILAGIHAGCYELIANERVQTVRDLKGKTIGVYALGGGDQVLVSSILAYIGMDPRKDVNWIAGAQLSDAMRFFVEGKVDAFMGFAPEPQELRAKKIGHVIIDTAQDRPWSQYFCCGVLANKDFVAKYPIATKRTLRALLKAADICAQEPERVARFLASKGYEPRYGIGLEVLKSLPYSRWRNANPEDTLRFHALRLHEVGMIKTNPSKLIAQGTDWRFLNELKKELKA
jgi:NitT/TauT family transport system substrate-binding protein